MQLNIILSGVGGQGILTIARAISTVALGRGWRVKQSEVHGMSQRGGAVQAHLRLADHEISSDLIPLGGADMILSLEPLEALRYVEYLSQDGVIIANDSPVANMPNYGDAETFLRQIARHPNHVILDANRLASLAGSSKAVNMVLFGAASAALDLKAEECRTAIRDMLGSKGERAVDSSLRAFELGRMAAGLYREGSDSGIAPTAIRARLDKLTPGEIENAFRAGIDWSGASAHGIAESAVTAVDRIFQVAAEEQRSQLLEPEVYSIIEAAGAITPPRHVLVRDASEVTAELLARFPGERIIAKVVSPRIVHKSDAGAVLCLPRESELVAMRVGELLARARSTADRVDGALLVEYVDPSTAGFGSELFVGIRSTPQFGPVIAAGLGGIDTEYLAAKLRGGLAVAKSPVCDSSPDDFFEQFRRTVAYEILSGQARGHRRIVSDGSLRRCFRAFYELAGRFCLPREENRPELIELEVNPFAFRRNMLVPLDGRGRLGRNVRPLQRRPSLNVDRLLVPRSMAVAGVSSKRQNFGRIILTNTLACGFPPESFFVIKQGERTIDGVRCVGDIEDLPAPVDLLVVATDSAEVSAQVQKVLETGRAGASIIIAGGMGERAGTEKIHEALRERIDAARGEGGAATVFLGENCMGVRSRPGRYDTFFIPDKKLDPRRAVPPRPLALVSQSGAFVVSLLSKNPALDPVFTVSLGNQLDLTLSDLVDAVGRREDVDVIGVYAEGFRHGDGLEFLRAVQRARAAGKQVVFYKAGRTESGRAATAGHTACVAGDYDVCLSAVEQAGAIVTESLVEFEDILEVAVALHRVTVRGTRVAAVTNAGCEAVAMADAVTGPRHAVSLPKWSATARQRLGNIAARHKLDSLVNIANPLDITPAAGDRAYEEFAAAMLDVADVDAVIVSTVPLTPQMKTVADELEDDGALCRRLPALSRAVDKPLVVVVSAGDEYRPYVRRLREGGLPVLRTGDEAMRALGRYLCHRCPATNPPALSEARSIRQSGNEPSEASVTNAIGDESRRGRMPESIVLAGQAPPRG